MSVLPPQSAKLLPNAYADLMTNENSPLSSYYPPDFEVDANGKKNSWEYVVRIPFINEKELLSTVSLIDHKSSLTETERIRNINGKEHRYILKKK